MIAAGREYYDAVAGVFRSPGAAKLPRIPQLEWFAHRCPDGTWVRASAQYLSTLQVTLYRFTVRGTRVGSTTAAGDATAVEPDWAALDARHGASAA